ncbi:O-methyltransferase family protein [Rhynchospora pubera]|uniref:O-methyltransferase family protein n=1 Tax=Rhynchospora pubera TaxID=906938 RepID=A0AAV8FVZ4_9POAL|nr:O-methyltransferase family protein [Rhynchospora pubera]
MDCTLIENLSLSYISSFALRCAVDLDISGRIQAYGRPIPLNELARSIPTPPEKDLMLGRLMTLLVHQGVFGQSQDGWNRLSEVFKDTGNCTLFEKLHDGKKAWEIVKEIPEYGNTFNEAMASQSNSITRGLVARCSNIFDGLNSLVDVGGGTGTTVKIIDEAIPGLKCTLFDLPHVVKSVLKSDSPSM